MNQREAFEVWQLDTGRTDPMYLVYSNKDNRYALNNVQSDWEAWQAAWQAALASQWQPISTAPKDGSVIIGASKLHDEWRYEEVWYCHTYGFGGGQYGDPEFWMPLPPEPAK